MTATTNPKAKTLIDQNKVEKNNNQENIKSLFVPNTSHDFHTEKPVEIAECIGEFLKE